MKSYFDTFINFIGCWEVLFSFLTKKFYSNLKEITSQGGLNTDHALAKKVGKKSRGIHPKNRFSYSPFSQGSSMVICLIGNF